MTGPLVPSETSSAGFKQTGTVNWTDLSTRTVEFAFGALTRYSKAGVDTATVAVGQTICLSFKMPPEIKKKVIDHIQALPHISMYGRVVRFGFGLQHVLQDLCERDTGITCACLCGCLKENYDSFYGAQVLRLMCRNQNVPEDMLPGTQRWIALLKTCAGLFAATDFPKLVYGLTQFVHPRTRYGVAELGATEPESLAKAILALAKVSTGDLESCTFSGGIDCAWLGAVANFLFGLSVSVKQADGVVPFQTDTGRRLFTGESQVTILQIEADMPSAEIVKRSVFLPSGQTMFRESVLGKRGVSQFEMRAQWDTILRDAFGPAIEDLLKNETRESFVKLMTFSARRVPEADNYNSFDSTKYKYEWPDLRYGSHAPRGDSLLDFAFSRLPELRPALEESPYRRIGDISELMAVGLVQKIQKSCACPACSGRKVDIRSFTCLLGVAGAIIRFVGLLSIAKVQDLLPTPFGLRQLYENSKPINRDISSERARWEHKWPLRMSNVLREIFMLFSTPGSFKLIDGAGESRLALASEGVCCFYGFAADIRCNPSDAAKVYVMPGHIEHAGAMYERIEDMRIENERWQGFTRPLVREYGFYVSETMDSNTLQVACTPRPKEPGPSTIFQAGRIVLWAYSCRLLYGRGCSQQLLLPDYIGYQDPEDGDFLEDLDYYQESSWEILCGLQENDNMQNLCRDSPADAQTSLILITSDGEHCDNLHIEKTSVDFWKQPKASVDQLYAEYGRSYELPQDRMVHYELAEVSDCPRCILNFVSSIWPQHTGPYVSLPDQVIQGSVMVHGLDTTVRTSFRLERIADNVSMQSRRTFPVGCEGMKKPFPVLNTLEVPKSSWRKRLIG